MLVALFVAFAPSMAWGQTETGQISGAVKDSTGAVIAGAEVTATSVGTQAKRSTTTDANGEYRITSLLPAVYEVSVAAPGFSTRKVQVQVTVGSKVGADFELVVGSDKGEIVEVLGESGIAVNTVSQTLQSVVSEKQLKELPTATRNPYALVVLSGNVSDSDPSGRGAGVAINGQRSASTNVLLDGSDNNDQFTATVGQNIPLDSVQEYSIVTSNFSAEYGRAGGGVVNVATKSGTNEFHGTAYEFNRISALASNDFNNNSLQQDKGVFTRNQFGYSAGGRILKDKMFFFSSGEFIRVRSVAPVTSVVATPQLIAASDAATRNFFQGYDLIAGINGRVFTRAEIPGQTSTGAFSKLPAGLPVFGNTTYNIPTNAGAGSPQNSYQFVNRFDWNISDKSQLYVRYALESINAFPGTNGFSPYKGFNTGSENFNNNILGSFTHTFTPRLITQTKVVYNRLNSQQPLAEQPVGPTLYTLANGRSPIGGNLIAFPGYLPTSPGNAIPFGGPQNLVQFFEDASYNLGKHDLRFGGQFVKILDNRVFGAYQNAVLTLGSSFGNALDNLVLGRARQFQAAVDPKGAFPGDTVNLPLSSPQFGRNNRYNEFALYFNDAWSVRSNVKVNLGVRYEYYGVQHNKDKALDSNFYYGTGANIFEQIRNGKVMLTGNSPIGDLYKKDKNNFAPRVGFAWDIFGDGKWSLRGGYGIGYERNFGNVTFNVIQNPPNYAVVSLVAGADVPTIPISRNNSGPLSGTGKKTLPAVTLRALDPNLHNAFAHTWGVSLQHQIYDNTVVSLEYSGSKGTDLYDISNLNRVSAGAVYLNDPTRTARLNKQYGSINSRGNGGFSNYNALVVKVESRNLYKTGLYLTANYTWAHALDNLSSTFSESTNNGSFNLGYLDPFNPKLDKGHADFDQRHRFVFSGIWDIPFAKNTTGWQKRLLDGWSLNYIYTAATGTPFSIFDTTNIEFGNAVPRLIVGGNAPRISGSPAATTTPNEFKYVDLSGVKVLQHTNPITGNSEFGPFPSNMTARNAFRGPGFWNLDASIGKRISITEKYSLQLRAEAFNLFNHANLFLVGDSADYGSQDFVTAKRFGNRNVQLAVKFIF
ncbi:MAG: TonB-dependent receptor [Blastocatellia bacterium]|nr:TonB-dependent receptor [Blastocatellia bacterium]